MLRYTRFWVSDLPSLFFGLLFVVLLLIISCSKGDTIKGDLFFKLVDFGSYYNADDDWIESFEKKMDSVMNTPNVSENWRESYEFIQKLKKNGLIKKPHIYLQLPYDSVVRIYLSGKEYEKVKDFSKSELQKTGFKVQIELEFEKKDEGLYYSDRIIEVKKVEGKTPWKK